MKTARVLSVLLVLATFLPHASAQCPWSQHDQIATPGGPANEYFGYPVAVSGDDAVVGAPADHNALSGSVYVLRRSGSSWSVAANLVPAVQQPLAAFGAAVAISGDWIVVGAPYENAQGFHTGAAYVFARSGGVWTEVAHLVASNAFRHDYFGSAVAIDGTTALIGAYGTTLASIKYNGSAYFFELVGGTWTEMQEVFPVPGGERGLFGRTAALQGDIAVIGAPMEDYPIEDGCGLRLRARRERLDLAGQARAAGAASRRGVRCFGRPLGQLPAGRSAALRRLEGALRPRLGVRVPRHGRRLGADRRDLAGRRGAGRLLRLLGRAARTPRVDRSARRRRARHRIRRRLRVRVRRLGLAAEGQLHALDAAPGARFGFSVALGMGVALLGGPRALNGSPDPGFTYAFDVPGSPTGYGAGCPGSSATTPDLAVIGCPTAGGVLTLRVQDGTPGARVLVLVGRDRAAIALPNGCSEQLVTPIMQTILLPPISAYGTSMATLQIPAAAAPGWTFTFQAFLGDPSVPNSFATSNGVEIVLE